MIRKIAARALQPGMYIHALGCSWVDHPFLLNRFVLRSAAEIEKILDAGITDVEIDTDRGADVPPPRLVPEPAAPNGVQAPPPARAPSPALAGRPPGVSAAAAVPSAAAAAQPGGPSEPAEQPGAASPPPAAPAIVEAAARTTGTEFRAAKRVHAESARVVREILADARLGKQVSIERTRAVVTQMSESILSNPGPLLALCRLKQKDQYTFLHCVSVSALLMVFARAAGFDEHAIRDAGLGGLLHDIGKMKIPQETLNKAGPLTGEERAAMQGHVTAGIEILRATPGVPPVAMQITAEHHERFDGSGYPMKLTGERISRIGHMAALVDVYDAITSDRVYHRGVSPQDALKRLLDGSGTHFDPEPVQLLIKTLGIYPVASLVMLESGRLAIVVDQSSGNLLQPRVRVVYDTRKAAFVRPFDLDLARTAGHGGEDRILRHESPQKWSVDPVAYLLEDIA